MRKLKGYINNVPVYTDQNCPPNMVYFFNDNNQVIASIDMRSKWQRVVQSIKRVFVRKAK